MTNVIKYSARPGFHLSGRTKILLYARYMGLHMTYRFPRVPCAMVASFEPLTCTCHLPVVEGEKRTSLPPTRVSNVITNIAKCGESSLFKVFSSCAHEYEKFCIKHHVRTSFPKLRLSVSVIITRGNAEVSVTA